MSVLLDFTGVFGLDQRQRNEDGLHQARGEATTRQAEYSSLVVERQRSCPIFPVKTKKREACFLKQKTKWD